MFKIQSQRWPTRPRHLRIPKDSNELRGTIHAFPPLSANCGAGRICPGLPRFRPTYSPRPVWGSWLPPRRRTFKSDAVSKLFSFEYRVRLYSYRCKSIPDRADSIYFWTFLAVYSRAGKSTRRIFSFSFLFNVPEPPMMPIASDG